MVCLLCSPSPSARRVAANTRRGLSCLAWLEKKWPSDLLPGLMRREVVCRCPNRDGCPLASPCVGKADGGGAPCRRNCDAGCCEGALRITRPAVAGCGLAKAWWTGVTRMAIGCSCGGTFRRQRTYASGGGRVADSLCARSSQDTC